jgi:hypothetical protein
MKELNTQPIMKFIENYRVNLENPCSPNALLKNPIPNSLMSTKWMKTLQTLA